MAKLLVKSEFSNLYHNLTYSLMSSISGHEVNLDSISASHVFIVAKKLTVDCLLGIDFLSKHGAVLDCARNTLSFHCNTGYGGRVFWIANWKGGFHRAKL